MIELVRILENKNIDLDFIMKKKDEEIYRLIVYLLGVEED